MIRDPLRGRTFDFVFTDGQMAGKTFTHVFGEDGTVTFSSGGSAPKSATDAKKPSAGVTYQFTPLRERIYAFSYRSDAGYTLTAILDFETEKLVAFVSSEKMAEVDQGIFKEIGAPAKKSERRDRVHTHN